MDGQQHETANTAASTGPAESRPGRRSSNRYAPVLAAAATAVIALAVTGTVTALRPGVHESPGPISARPSPSSPVNERGTVPWVDRAGQPFFPSPLPTTPPPTDARACTGVDVRVGLDAEGRNGGGGHLYQTLDFRNVSRSTCVLAGFPRVVAVQPGHPDVVAADGGFFVGHDEVSANMPPGGTTYLRIETEFECPARDANPLGRLLYQQVTVGLPGGGLVVVGPLSPGFDVTCGLFTGRFSVPQPPQPYTSPPLQGARVALELPSAVAAGTTLSYVVDITNPTLRDMPLFPCPAYDEFSLGFQAASKRLHALNCDSIDAIPAGETVRYAMRLPVPRGAPAGETTLKWTTAAPDSLVCKSLEILG